jgi:hypothetical protein
MDMLWSGWGDPAKAAPLPDAVVGLLRDLLGVRTTEAAPLALEEIEIADPRLGADVPVPDDPGERGQVRPGQPGLGDRQLREPRGRRLGGPHAEHVAQQPGHRLGQRRGLGRIPPAAPQHVPRFHAASLSTRLIDVGLTL